MTPRELAEKICSITDYEIVSDIESLLTEAMEEEGLKHDAERAGWNNTLRLKTDLAKADAFEEAAKIADEHNGCIERVCLDRGLNCGVTIADQIRQLAKEIK